MSTDRHVDKLTYNLKEAAAATGLSIPYFRKLIAAGKLKSVRAGSRVLIPDAELRRFLGLPLAQVVTGADFAILTEHRDVM